MLLVHSAFLNLMFVLLWCGLSYLLPWPPPPITDINRALAKGSSCSLLCSFLQNWLSWIQVCSVQASLVFTLPLDFQYTEASLKFLTEDWVYYLKFIKYHFMIVSKFICHVVPAERTILWLSRVLGLGTMQVFCMCNALDIWAMFMHLCSPLGLSLCVKTCTKWCVQNEALRAASRNVAAGTVR